MTKIYQINSVCGIGSTGRIVTDLYETLVKEGNECRVAYGRGSASSKFNTYRIGNNIDVLMHTLKTRLTDKHGFGSRWATKQLVKDISEYKPDVILLHNIHGYYLNIEVLFNYLSTLSIPIIWLLHDQWAFSGHSAYFKLTSTNEIPIRNTDYRQKYEYPKSILLDNSEGNYITKRELFTKIDDMTIITPSNWLANLVKKSFLSKYKVKVIHNGIDINNFNTVLNKTNKFYAKTEKKMILGVANIWEERKGLSFFNELANQCNDKYRIVLVGVDNKQKKKINSRIETVNKTNSVEELAYIYSSADVFLNPTLEDNFPTTNLEALACGTPVITFNTGGSPEAIDETSGIVTSKKNVESIIEALELFEDKKFSKTNCRRRGKLFSKEIMMQKYLELF